MCRIVTLHDEDFRIRGSGPNLTSVQNDIALFLLLDLIKPERCASSTHDNKW